MVPALELLGQSGAGGSWRTRRAQKGVMKASHPPAFSEHAPHAGPAEGLPRLPPQFSRHPRTTAASCLIAVGKQKVSKAVPCLRPHSQSGASFFAYDCVRSHSRMYGLQNNTLQFVRAWQAWLNCVARSISGGDFPGDGRSFSRWLTHMANKLLLLSAVSSVGFG